MTLASDIIKSAYRETNLIPLGQSPTTNQQTEALGLLNTLLLSTVGNEAGDGLDDLNIGGNYDESTYTTTWLPDNVRLQLNLTSAKTYNLDPYPKEGQRLAIVDVGDNLATYNVTINGNGRLIEGASSVTLDTDSDTRQWMYRSDTGNWVKITSLIAADEVPFPAEFDDYFITMLALRLSPRFAQEIRAETMKALVRMRGQLNARYAATKEVLPDVDGRGLLSDKKYYGRSNSSDFDTGRPYRYR